MRHEQASEKPIPSGISTEVQQRLAIAHGSADKPGKMSGRSAGMNMMLPPTRSTIRATE